jgi:Ca2+-binding RTX toxin-like protein
MLTVFTTNSIGTGSRLIMSAGDSVYVKAGVIVASTDYITINASAGVAATIHGDVFSGTTAIYGQQRSTIKVGDEGEVNGAIKGIVIAAGAGHLVENHGAITGGSTALDITTDSGLGRSLIVNTGTISGNYAIQHNYFGADGHVMFINQGNIYGSAAAYSSGEAGHSTSIDIIKNTGAMAGYVSLGAGDDIYRGGKGSLSGEIYGGSGNDRINCGDDDDRIYGGDGTDRLRGGDGEDQFFLDTSISGNMHSDKILDFSAANDKIMLDDEIHGLVPFTWLEDLFVSNKSGKAEDADDRIIYQTSTGKLYCDLDGKGGAGSAVIAILDKNLDLTHENFGVF